MERPISPKQSTEPNLPELFPFPIAYLCPALRATPSPCRFPPFRGRGRQGGKSGQRRAPHHL